MKKSKTLILILLGIFSFWIFALSSAQDIPVKNQKEQIKSPEDLKSFFRKSRSLRDDFKISDLELRLAISFALDSDSLNAEAKAQLDNLAKVLLDPEFSKLLIELAGHTCDLGDASYNFQLSQRRVKSAADYLVKKYNIAPNRIATKAYGKSMPLIPGAKDEVERAVNRRVVTYLPENRATIEKMLEDMPYFYGFSWAVFRIRKDGKTELVNYDGSSILKSDDEYRIFLRPARKKYVYIFQEDSKGVGQWLFPRKDIAIANPLQPGEYFLPSQSKVFVLDNTVGTETIYLVVTDEPAKDLEILIEGDSSNLVSETVLKIVKTRGLKKIKIGPPAKSANVTPNTIVISPPQSGTKKPGDSGVSETDIANVMAHYSEFFMVIEFGHR